MAQVTLQGTPINTSGNLPAVGSKAPNFALTNKDLATSSLENFAGKRVILNIFPSVDTGTCAASVRQFNKEAAALENTVVVCVSKDLPFAQNRFCGAEGLENVVNLSEFKNADFGKAYGVDFTDGPLQGLLSRAVVVIDQDGTITHTEQVAEIADEPNYKAALEVLQTK